jgi:hypothetical protein
MTYQDFVANFPQLLLVQYQILLMKTLINVSMYGTFPEQVFAKITLTKMSLPYPYAKFANKAAQKMYKKSFDAFGNFVLADLNVMKHPYKKFEKKVAQSWKQIALQSNSFSTVIQAEYESRVAVKVDTPYNNALIKMIHAGMKADMEILENLRTKFAGNEVIEKILNYYARKET